MYCNFYVTSSFPQFDVRVARKGKVKRQVFYFASIDAKGFNILLKYKDDVMKIKKVTSQNLPLKLIAQPTSGEGLVSCQGRHSLFSFKFLYIF